MEILQGLESVPANHGPCVVTIGVFDGLHLGHRALVNRAVAEGRSRGLPVVLVTFDPHPMDVVRPGKQPRRLSTVRRRAELAAELGIDEVLVVTFTQELARQAAEDFVAVTLVESLAARVVVVGSNFTYGYRALGTVDTLRTQGAELGIDVVEVNLLAAEDHAVSSTYVRECLQRGDVAAAGEALGRPHRLEGLVVHGEGRGGTALGFPTANIETPLNAAIPADGVYAGLFTVLDEDPIEGDLVPGTAYPTAVSIGLNPTFGDTPRTVEAFILDRKANLYGRFVAIDFIEWVRGMVKFDSVEALVAGITADVDRTRRIVTEWQTGKPS